MINDAWLYIQDPSHREIIAWILGGLCIAIGGIWAVYKYVNKNKNDKNDKGDKYKQSPKVSSNNGSISIGGNANKSSIKVRKAKR